MPTSENADHVRDASGAAVEAPTVDSPRSFRFQLKLSGWWLFPVLLAVWVLAARKGGVTERASSLLEQSMTNAQDHQYAACFAAAGQAVKLDPGLAEAHNNAGWCAANMGQWDEGIRYAREAVRLKPDLEIARNNLTWMLAEKAKRRLP